MNESNLTNDMISTIKFVKIIFFSLIFIFKLTSTNGDFQNFTFKNDTTTTIATTTASEESKVLFVIYIFPVILIIGSICNVITFLVMRRKKLRNQSTGFYMAILAIADELALLVGCLNYWLYEYKRIFILHTSTIACKAFSVILYTTMDFSVWMVVIMTIERFIAVSFPLKSMYVCTVKKAKLATLVLVILLFTINSQFLLTHSLTIRSDLNSTEQGCQSRSGKYDFFMNKLWPWIDASKYSFVPLLTIIVFNVLIISNMIKASSSRKKLAQTYATPKAYTKSVNQNNHVNLSPNNGLYTSTTPHASSTSQISPGTSSSSSSSSNNRRLTVMLLSVSITFCILSIPLVLLQILEKAEIGSLPYQKLYPYFLFLQYFNHSINFFLYVFSGKIFRRECIALFSVCTQCLKKNIHKNDNSPNKSSDINYYSKLNVKNNGYHKVQNKSNRSPIVPLKSNTSKINKCLEDDLANTHNYSASNETTWNNRTNKNATNEASYESLIKNNTKSSKTNSLVKRASKSYVNPLNSQVTSVEQEEVCFLKPRVVDCYEKLWDHELNSIQCTSIETEDETKL